MFEQKCEKCGNRLMVCIECGKSLIWKEQKYCPEHKKLQVYEPKQNLCVVCKKIIGKYGHKYCSEHMPYHIRKTKICVTCGKELPKYAKLYCSEHTSFPTKRKPAVEKINEVKMSSEEMDIK